MKNHIKIEHAGSKKRKGFWGRKKEAKAVSRKKRRAYGKIETASDSIEPGRPHCSDYLHQKIPGSKMTVIEGCGHMVQIEKPDVFCDIVDGFRKII